MSYSSLNKVTNTVANTLASRFFESCRQFPHKNAVFSENQHYTYSELYVFVEAIYQQICEQTAGKSIVSIGVYCDNSIMTAAAILAISAYGAAYVPLNPDFPKERNQFIVEDCGLSVVLVFENILEKIGEVSIIDDIDGVEFIEIKAQIPLESNNKKFVLRQIVEQNTAYILYTSGSTGKPKGVPVTFDNVRQLFDFVDNHYDFNENDRFLQVFEWTFDISVFAFFCPLYVGGCCYFLPNTGMKFMNILQSIQQNKINVLCLVPSVLNLSKRYFDELNFDFIRYFIFSGEALTHSLAVEWSKVIPNAQIENFYGLTETAVFMTHYLWENDMSEQESLNGIVPLGKLFPGIDFLLLDNDDNELNNLADTNDSSEVGELCVSGPQIIEAYVNNVQPERFFDRTINGKTKRFYKTGDLVRLSKRGNFVYVGRNDEQVQLQGHRVELKEVEYHLKKITQTPVAVVVQKKSANEERLVGFVEQSSFTENQIIAALSKSLSYYMVPKRIIVMDALPLSLNGKIDKKTLRTYE